MFENLEDLRKAREKAKKVTYEWNVIPSDDSPEIISEKWRLLFDELCEEYEISEQFLSKSKKID